MNYGKINLKTWTNIIDIYTVNKPQWEIIVEAVFAWMCPSELDK